MKKKECYIPTQDNWHPNYPDDTVKLSLSRLQDGMWRVAVWGADDLGMDMDFEKGEMGEACKMYYKLTRKRSLEQKYLERVGFNYF